MLPEQFSRLDRAVARRLAHVRRATAPPVDAIELAGALGLTVVRSSLAAGRASLVRPARRARWGSAGPLILLNDDEPRTERKQWAVAHEIGEHLAVQVAEEIGLNVDDIGEAGREQLANLIAGRLLVPTAALAKQGTDCDFDLPALKGVFSTASHELIARRLLDLGRPLVVSIFDHGRLTFRRSNAGRGAALSELEQDAQRQAHLSNEPVDVAGPPRVRAWPVHEPEWKREIVFLTLPDEGCEW